MLGSIYYYDIVKNTNDEAKNLVENFNVISGLVVADNQQAGRGRFGKKWNSIKGNFMGSLFFPVKNYDEINIMQYHSLNIVLKCLKKIFKKNIFKIKEPNDILINHKKVSGILIESFLFYNQLYVIIGIGINMTKHPKIIGYKTTNLHKEFKIKVGILEFSKILLKEMESSYKCS